MQTIRLGDQSPNLASSVVTLGNFDGVHLGHRALICGAAKDAKARGIPSVVLTFEPHPLKVLAPERAPKLIVTHEDKIRLLEKLGVDIVAVQRFDWAFARLSPEAFVQGLLVEELKAKKLWVGKDLRFGRARQGGVGDLLRWGDSFGFEVSVVDPVVVDQQRVSSSRIRELLGLGQVEQVKPLLGRYHFVSGRVAKGHGRGRDLGFPTANIAATTEVLPLDGIYATILDLGHRSLRSVSSIGTNPTFGTGPRTVESYIMNFEETIYDAAVRLSFIQRIRDEKKFSSVPDLVAQMRADAQSAEAILRDVKLTPALD